MKRKLKQIAQTLWRRTTAQWEKIYHPCSEKIDRLLYKITGPETLHDQDFDASINWTISEQTPRGARLLVWATAASLVGALLWASIAKLDEVTKGDGKVIPSSHVQDLQSLDGGIVSDILVKEGQDVKAGQVLVKIDPTRMVSSLQENQSQHLALLAKAARLKALSDGISFETPEAVLKKYPQLVNQEKMLYESKKAELDAALGIAKQQAVQRVQELVSVRARREQAVRSYQLTSRELELTKPLVRSGAVSDVELLRLERDVARFKGEQESADADIPRLIAAVAEANRKIQESELTFKNTASNELSEVNAKLATLDAGSGALQDRVKQTEIRSPVAGTVNRLRIDTIGGVLKPGDSVGEVVPRGDTLMLEARVMPRDIAFVHKGQKAMVKFSAYDFSIYGGMPAVIDEVGSNTVTDDKGNAFFMVKVRTDKQALGVNRLPIIPGMVAEVDIVTGRKSVLTYLMKPLLRAKADAFTER